jgi:uncharacterized RDD family membrane protein YckC
VSRVLANIIDAALVGAFVGACYLGWVALQFLLDPRAFTWPDTRWIVTLTTGLCVATVYFTLAWWLAGGRSYGDHVMGLRVVGRRGHRLGPLRSLMRAAFCVFFPIGLFWCIVSPKRRSVQDAVLWTKVVYDWTPRVQPVHTPAPHGIGAEVVESVVVAGNPQPGAAPALDTEPRRLRARTRPPTQSRPNGAGAGPPTPPEAAGAEPRDDVPAATDQPDSGDGSDGYDRSDS